MKTGVPKFEPTASKTEIVGEPKREAFKVETEEKNDGGFFGKLLSSCFC